MQTFEEELKELVRQLVRCEKITKSVKEKNQYDPRAMKSIWEIWTICMEHHRRITDRQLMVFERLNHEHQVQQIEQKNKLRLVKK